MDTMTAFMKGESSRNRSPMVFDWIKAAKLIVENRNCIIKAGLAGDWDYTGGIIWENGEPASNYVYLASTWATPEIEIAGYRQDCFIYQTESPNAEWDAHTYYPIEARRIIAEKFGNKIFKNIDTNE
jgi:hypothetical protein